MGDERPADAPGAQASTTPQWWSDAESLMVERRADRLDHPGGTLLEHVRRVAGLLAAWGNADAVVAAGLCHACYGTDGFGPALLDLDERWRLRAAIGKPGERFVYEYASCDRKLTYPRLADLGPLALADRFTAQTVTLDDDDAAVFVELTAANELDLVQVNPEIAVAWGPGMLELLRSARHRVSGPALSAWEQAVTG